MPEEIRIGEGAVGWTSRGRGEERGGGLVVGFVTRLSKWTNVLSDPCTFESNNNDSQVELRALFALASMNKQRVLTRTGYSNEYSHQLAFEFVLVRVFTCALSASYHQADIITNRKTNKNTRYLHKYVENDPQTPLPPSLCRHLLLQLFLLSNPLSRWREAKLLELLGVILAGLCSNDCLEKPWKVVDSTMYDGQNSPLQLP